LQNRVHLNIKWLLAPILRLGPSLFNLAARWWHGRSFRLLLQGLPALLVGLATLAALILGLSTPNQELQARYLSRAQAAFQAKDYQVAQACYDRLVHLGGDKPEVLYEIAVTAEAAGHPERALAMMQQLAPIDSQGYGKAHAWQAASLLMTRGAPARQAALTHLQRALEAGVDDTAGVHALLGDLYLAKGQLDEAELHLVKAAQTKPHVRLRLAYLFAQRGNKERARTEALLAINFFSTWASADLFAHQARLRWAEAAAFLEDFPRAVNILSEGLTGTGAPLYSRALAEVHAAWFDFLGRLPRPDHAARLAVLERGLQHDAKNIALLNRLLDTVSIRDDRGTPQATTATVGLACPLAGSGPWLAASAGLAHRSINEEQTRALLRRLLAQGEAPAQAHFALGVDAWAHGQVSEARLHWERANQLAPDMPAIANNLAWLLSQSDPPDLPRALQLADMAVEKSPRETNFRDTRGHILMKMGRWKEALADLEAALPSTPNPVEMHLSLAEVYQRLDAPAMAAEHQRLAKEKTPKAKPPN
jgi:tetratricopeptide (TPR) repeat protein